MIAGAPPPQPTTGQADCAALLLPAAPIEHGFKLPGGQRAVLRDPYGGVVSRNGQFVQFTVKGARRDQLVDHVEWRLDGAAIAGNRGGRYSLLLQSTKLQAGAHSLTAHVVLRDGSAVDKATDLNVTDCQRVSFTAGPNALSVDSGGPELLAVGFTLVKGLRARIPRGRSAGTLTLGATRLALRGPRRGAVLLHRGALKVTIHRGDFLAVTGLPAQTTTVRLTLRGVLRPTARCATVRATLLPADGGGAAALDDRRC